jgi:putative ABC transport system permease protein
MLFRMLFARRRASASLDDELLFHLDHEIAQNIAAGMTPAEARSAALRSFGNPALLRDQARSAWKWSRLESLLRDVRLSARSLLRSPGFTTIAIAVIALGIGANVALFTVVRGVLLRPLPFRDPSRLLMLYESVVHPDEQLSTNVVAGGIYSEWNKQNHSFENLALMKESLYALAPSGSQTPEKLLGAQVSWNLFSTLGVQPALGRDFSTADDNLSANFTAILSWGLYKRRYGADPTILGRTVTIDAKPYTVIGVMPEGFQFPGPGTQVWTTAYRDMPAKFMAMLDSHAFQVVGRLKPGVTETQARAELSTISRRLHETHPDNPFIFPAANSRPLLDHMVGDLRRPLYVLLAATACLLLIACINVANLLVARAVSRRREMAIRTALGGGRMRLLRERLIETVLLSFSGGALGLLLAFAAITWLTHMRQDMSRIESVRIDATVCAFTVGIVALCALVAGFISALTVRDRRLLSALHESSRSAAGSQARATLRRVLLTAEVGLTVMLLIGAGLLLKSYQRLRAADMGCATDNVLTLRIGLPGARYKTPGPAPAEFFDRMLQRVRALPGVDAAGFINAAPGQGYWEDSSFTILEHPPLPQGSGVTALNRTADPGYFAAMGIPTLRGRTFNPGLRLEAANEIIISDAFVHKYFPGEEPLGKHLKTNERVYTIVGVVGDTRAELGEQPGATKYFPFAEGKVNYGTLIVRSHLDVKQLVHPVSNVIQEMDRDLPIADVMTMDELLGKSVLDASFDTTLLTGFAALSLLLAAVGLFGVLSYVVAQRTTEIGIRMALGAQRGQVLGRMLADGLRPALIGLALGLLVSSQASRVLRDMLYETRPLDPWVFVEVSVTLIAVAAVACLLPAWRAARTNPMQALRTE